MKRYVEEKEEITISSSVLYNIIKNLEDMSIIHNYRFLEDSIYREASLKNLNTESRIKTALLTTDQTN